ncbi:MAG: glycosyltransferase family 4 protein [Actinomycetota bacterium]
MRIAMVAPVWVAVPPPGYGGIELVTSLLTEELVARGHDVTLFASGGSQTKATLRSAFEEPPTDRLWETEPDASHVGSAYRMVEREYSDGNAFDLVHDNTEYLGVAFAACLATPVVHTVHFPLTDLRRAFLRRFADDVYLAAISEFQRSAAPELPWAGRVHNAIDVESFELRGRKDGYLLCIGRVCERKGQDIAVEVARRAGLPLVLAGRVHPKEAAFFTERVEPHVDGQRVVFEGEVTADRKRELVAGASALLLPIREPEPFGLVMIEAFASGTPVIGSPLGAVPEIVTDGVTGFLSPTAKGMAAAVERLGEIDPAVCRREAEEHYAPGAMADGYEALYHSVLEAL